MTVDEIERGHAGLRGYIIRSGDGADGMGVYHNPDTGEIHVCMWVEGAIRLTTSVGQPYSPSLRDLLVMLGVTLEHCRRASGAEAEWDDRV